MDTNKTSIVLSPPPHLGTRERVRGVMTDVLIALAPAVVLGVVNYGLRALTLFAASVAAAILCAVITTLATHKSVGTDAIVGAVLLGVLTAMPLGVCSPVWVAAVSGAAAALLSCLTDTRDHRAVFHPALAASVLVFLLFPNRAGAYGAPLDGFMEFFAFSAKAFRSALEPAQACAAGEAPILSALLIGAYAGGIGTSSALALIVGCGYLMLRRLSTLRTPLTAMIVLFAAALLFPVGDDRFAYAAAQTFGGEALFTAIIYLLPASGAPLSRRGQSILGVVFGCLCFAVRRISGIDGALAAALYLQAFTWIFDLSRRPGMFSAARLAARIEQLLLSGSKNRTPALYVAPEPAAEPEPEPELEPESAEPAEISESAEETMESEEDGNERL